MVRRNSKLQAPDRISADWMMNTILIMVFSGKLQFLVALRDPAVADVSGSNGFESDNDANGSTNTPSPTAFSAT